MIFQENIGIFKKKFIIWNLKTILFENHFYLVLNYFGEKFQKDIDIKLKWKNKNFKKGIQA